MSNGHIMGAGQRKRLRQQLLEEYPYCVHCGKYLYSYDPNNRETWATLEHIVPLSSDGIDDISNLALACFKCNK